MHKNYALQNVAPEGEIVSSGAVIYKQKQNVPKPETQNKVA